jgi:hypothetical protein
MVYTPIKGTTCGGHFYNYDSMHLTEISLSFDSSYDEDGVARHEFGTNATHPDAHRLLARMTLGLPDMVTQRSKLSEWTAIIAYHPPRILPPPNMCLDDDHPQ